MNKTHQQERRIRPMAVKLPKITLHGEESGEGTKQTIIFVHGSPGRAAHWKRYLADPDLRKRFQMVAYDRPGFGRTSGPAISLEKNVDALVELIDQQATPVILVGHSLGGSVVLGATLERQEKIKHTLVLAGSTMPHHGNIRPLNLFLNKTFTKYMLPSSLRKSNDEMVMLRSSLLKYEDRWQEIRTPVTIVQGQRDFLVPARNADFLNKHLTGTKPKLILLPKEGHFLPWTQFEMIQGHLLEMGK